MSEDSNDPTILAPATPESLYRGHRVSLLTVATLMLDDREQAKEVVQDAFVELISRWDTINSSHALGYLYTTVNNRSRSWLRRRRTARANEGASVPVVPGADISVLQSDGYRTILAAVRRLPTKQRQVILLRYYADLDIAATAGVLNISGNAVAVNSYRALQTLRQELS